MLLLLWAVVLFISLLLFIRQVYSRFRDNGVRHPTPLALLRDIVKISLRLEHMAYINNEVYCAFPGERFVATNAFIRPMLMIKDLEVIKKITIKDFEHFLDHQHVIDEEVEPFIARNLLALRGQEWKDMRSTLSPAFTSSKIRLMVPHISDTCDQTILYLKKEIQEARNDHIDMDCKDIIARHTIDVIAACVFGYEVNSHVDRDNEFYEMGEYITSTTFSKMVRFLAWLIVPKIMRKLQIGLLTNRAKSFFENLVFNSIKNRKLNNIKRQDMVNILMEAKEGKLSHDDILQDVAAGYATVEESDVGKKKVNRVWSDNDLIAQALLFFLAGAETSSSTVTFLLFELAQNSDIQDKLAREVRDHHDKSNGVLDYNSLASLKYLDMVISEVLRLWPPAAMSDRTCTKTYNLGKVNDESTRDYTIHPGEGIFIPVWSIHRSAEYFPDPDKFDPDRFSEENKHGIKPFSYLPFGLGPRNCIGSRFALCQVKIFVYKLLLHLEVMPCEKTCLPVKLSGENIHLRIKGGHWLQFKIRTQ